MSERSAGLLDLIPSSKVMTKLRAIFQAIKLLEQFAVARRIIEDGKKLTTAWRMATAEGEYLVLAPFDMDKYEQRDKAIAAISSSRTPKDPLLSAN